MRLSDAEWTVMRAVWTRPPASARDVLDQVGGQTGWAYTTVKTLLARLVEKGALQESRRANANVYEPRITRDEARGSALRSLIDRAFDGTFGSLLQHLVTEERLSRRDLQALERMLDDVDRESAATGAVVTDAVATDAADPAPDLDRGAAPPRRTSSRDRQGPPLRPDSESTRARVAPPASPAPPAVPAASAHAAHEGHAVPARRAAAAPSRESADHARLSPSARKRR